MKIVPVKTQMKGQKQSHVCWALVFPDSCNPYDLADYRNALTQCAKYILSSEDTEGRMDDELFFLIQLADFITVGLEEYQRKKTTWEQFMETQLHELEAEAMRRKEEGGCV